MDVAKKLEYGLQHVKSIAGHDSEEGAVRIAALKKVTGACEMAIRAIEKETTAKIKALG